MKEFSTGVEDLLYSRERQLNYKNTICFSLSFITQNIWMGRVWKVEKDWAAHTGNEVQIFSETLFLPLSVGSKSSWLYNIPDTYTNSHGHISSSLPPTHCKWTYLLLVSHQYKFLSSYLLQPAMTHCMWLCFLLACHPYNSCCTSIKNTCILFTLGARCISCYFHSTGFWFLLLH